MRFLYYTSQAKFNDHDYIDCVRRCMQIIAESKELSKEVDNELNLVIKFQKKVTSRLQYFNSSETLNVLRMINQGL